MEKKYIDELESNENFKEWFELNKGHINSVYFDQRLSAQ